MGVDCGDGGLRTDDLIRGPDYPAWEARRDRDALVLCASGCCSGRAEEFPELLRALRRAGVEVAPQTSVAELRCLCDEVLRRTLFARSIA